ncbi:uncharacterized protein LOC128248726 [Octopus bimaculoides]|uniref:uncharacterized protein LOC128248726 n=1 Tax=Octopus bimaculoides TaxID=37653 RepID=UPI0022E8A977|nr:uncharacterized protein LOC128248726 [Octopus bimaculoides]
MTSLTLETQEYQQIRSIHVTPNKLVECSSFVFPLTRVCASFPIFSVVSLVCLTTSGRHEGGYLSLPLCWHFRIMVFILVLTLLSSFVVWTFHAIGLSSAFPINWYFLDMIAYSIFAFLYLVGASLVASAFDFYEKMQVGVTHQTIQQLILSVIIGYICLFLYGTTAVIGYRQWRIQLKQYQHRKLLEEDNFEV